MNILNRYIAREVLSSIFLVILILIGIETFIELIGELQDIGRGNYGVLQAFIYVPLQLPQDIYELFPAAVLIGGLMGLGKLARGSELMVMRASGFSVLQIVWAVVRIAILLLIIVTILGEWLAPLAQRYADQYKSYAETGSRFSNSPQSIWLHQDGEYVHIKQVLSDSSVNGVTLYRFQNYTLNQLINAQTANKTDQGWILNQVTITQFQPDRVILNSQPVMPWVLHVNPALIVLQQEDVTKMNAYTLYHAAHALKRAGLQSNQMQFNFWKRVLQPLATLIMIILAIPVILGPLRETTMAARLIIGVVIGFCFYTLNQFFGPFGMVYQLPPWWAASVPVLIFTAICLVMLWKIR